LNQRLKAILAIISRIPADPQARRQNAAIAHFVDHGIGHRTDEVGRHLDAVLLQQETLNLPHAHAAGVHRDDLVVEAGEASLARGDRHRIECAFAVARNLDVEKVVVGRDALAAGAVAVVRATRRLGFTLLFLNLGFGSPRLLT